MKQRFIGKQQHNQLLLFFSGWGMDLHPFAHLQSEDRDLMYCYDYRDLSFDTKLLSGYQDIRVMAWSLGVWVANQILSKLNLPVSQATAINGTLHPIDGEQGIPAAIFQGTIDHLNERTLKKFQRRMCQSADDYQTFMEIAPQREPIELKQELIRLQEAISSTPEFAIANWDRVYISLSDAIFPPENQQRAWENKAPFHLVAEGHYCPNLFKQLISHDQ